MLLAQLKPKSLGNAHTPRILDPAMAPSKGGVGNHVYYHKDGSVYGRGTLRAGVMTGYWEWYRKDGSLMRSGHFTAGEQSGEWTTYAKDGRIVKVTVMKPKAARTGPAPKSRNR